MKIINLDPKENLDRPVFKIINNSPCQHKHIVVDAENRSISCGQCSSVLDAFDVLLQLSDKESMIRKEIDTTNNKLKMLRKHHRALQKVLKKRVRYKCTHCKKYSEAVGHEGWDGNISRVSFKPVFDQS